jgi:uncharacterized protein YecE (DUF72 family)
MAAQLRIGTSGWSYQHWKGVFYPEDLPASKWLKYYSEHFDTVELNASFYRLFPRKTFEGWAAKAPNDFRYAVKMWRGITHLKRLKVAEESLKDVCNRMEGLGKAIGPILIQLPPSLHLDLDRLESFIKLLPQVSGFRYVLEVRHSSWFVDEFWELMNRYRIAFCIADAPGKPFLRKVTTDFVYVRFHGEKAIYAGKYSEPTLRNWASFLLEVLNQGKDVYAYFNNDMSGYAVTDAKELKNMIMENLP